MNSHYRTAKDLFLNITDELKVFIHSKSTQSYRLKNELLDNIFKDQDKNNFPQDAFSD